MSVRVELRDGRGQLVHVSTATTEQGLRRVLSAAASKGLKATVTGATGAERIKA